jgi:hypothetical protein
MQAVPKRCSTSCSLLLVTTTHPLGHVSSHSWSLHRGSDKCWHRPCSASACRLPKLKSIDLTIDAAMPRKERCRAGLELLLRTMRKHLSGLRNLSITSKQDWQGASKVWSKLAQLTQLTQLSLEFTEEVSILVYPAAARGSVLHHCDGSLRCACQAKGLAKIRQRQACTIAKSYLCHLVYSGHHGNSSVSSMLPMSLHDHSCTVSTNN